MLLAVSARADSIASIVLVAGGAVSLLAATALLWPTTRAEDIGRDERTRILHQIASGESLLAVLEAIAACVHRATGCPSAVMLLEGDSGRLATLATSGIDAQDAGRIGGDRTGIGCCGIAVARGSCELASELGGTFHACLAVAVVDSGGRPVGTVSLYRHRIGTFDSAGRELLRHAADLVSVAMSRTSADAAVQSLVEDLEERNAELERARVDAQQAQAKAEAAAQVKSEFLANMSHELRTPMTAILGFADVLAQGTAGEEERREHLTTIRRSGEHLLALINDILDLSKIEAGQMTVERTDMSPLQIMCDSIGMLRERARAKGVSLVTRCDGAVPVRISSDPTRLRQILINLIGNAVKFTDRGEVIVRVAMFTACDADRPKLMFEVSDSGIGMSPEVLPRLFKPFSQADGSMTRKYGGTGLGLAICRHLSEMLGGEIDVESELGRGSTFRVTVDTGSLDGVPMVAGLDAIAGRQSAEPRESTKITGRILVADDSLDNQRLLSFHLRRAGADVELVANGREAVRRALESLNERRGPFDLILMDMQMPELDGYQATAALRARGWNRPIVALTAHAAPDERDRCIAAGCDDFAAKPIGRDSLLEGCTNWLARSAESRRAAA